MSVKMEFPDEYIEILKSYAEQNDVTVQTAIADTLEFLELKNESFTHYRIAVENPGNYLHDPEELNAKAMRQIYMDLFGEDSVGDTIHCYYNPDRLNVLLMDIVFDDSVPLWTLIETFHNKIPGMEFSQDILSLFYVHDRFDGGHDKIAELMDWMNSDHEDDGFETAGYYESIYEEPDDEEFFDDEDFDDYDDEDYEFEDDETEE
ncbi:hypothetical protein [Oribacterium sp. WCC10]|uniref:hypothetical protein n=1 Tax=Oribacterium sp. WCC10 TaxID=1855343 RepID=UPI000B89BA0D|nr:hypothetical protein [Oribacterium sp. WCC10]